MSHSDSAALIFAFGVDPVLDASETGHFCLLACPCRQAVVLMTMLGWVVLGDCLRASAENVGYGSIGGVVEKGKRARLRGDNG